MTHDAIVRWPTPVEALQGAVHSGVLWRAANGRFRLDVPQVARYLVSDGRSVDVDPYEGAEVWEVRRFLEATPTAALYLQRGMPVLHAAVATNPNGYAVVLGGESGVGKSVLLASLLQRGWGIMGDDLSPVDIDNAGLAIAEATSCHVILWPENLERLAEATSNRSTISVTNAKPSGLRQAVDCRARFVDDKRPIAAIWWLGVHGSDRIEVQGIGGAARFAALGSMSYNRQVTRALLDPSSYFRVAGRVASSNIPIRRLMRPRSRWTADELADVIELAGSY